MWDKPILASIADGLAPADGGRFTFAHAFIAQNIHDPIAKPFGMLYGFEKTSFRDYTFDLAVADIYKFYGLEPPSTE